MQSACHCEIMIEMDQAGNQMDAVGFDFGTTNSSVAMLNGDSQVQLVSFSKGAAPMPSCVESP